MPFAPGEGGRPKGARNKSTVARERVVADAVALVNPVVDADLKPKDVLLTAMRESWAAHKAAQRVASSMKGEVDLARRSAMDMVPLDGEAQKDFEARRDAALKAVKVKADAAHDLRTAASEALQVALDCAHKAAPYEHPKLQTNTVQGDMSLNVTIKQF